MRARGVEGQRFDGFHISPSRFPKSSECTYRVHTILNPFPEQYHGLYDLFSMRYMAVSFKNWQHVSIAKKANESSKLVHNHNFEYDLIVEQNVAGTYNGKNLITIM